MQGNPHVSTTALLTAQAWRLGGFPNAELFDSHKGRWLLGGIIAARVPLWPILPPHIKQLEDYLKLRHQVIEQCLERRRPDMVIEIAAGLSPRGLTYAQKWPDTTYLEMDLPDMVAAKRNHLRGIDWPPNYHLQETDILASDFIEKLSIRPHHGQTLMVITEGLIPYLSYSEKQQAWRNIKQLMAAADQNSRYVMECYPAQRLRPRSLIGKASLGLMSALVRRRLHDNLYESDERLIKALTSVGFEHVAEVETQRLAKDMQLNPQATPYLVLECGLSNSQRVSSHSGAADD